MKLLVFLILFISLSLLSCEKTEEYSVTPEIKYVKTTISTGTDQLGNTSKILEVQFSFVDGDGDLGLTQADTNGVFAPGEDYYYNLKFQLLEKINGQFILNESEKHNFRFQNISKQQTNNKVLKGDMITKLYLSTENNYADTIKLSFFIYDRALNKSNIEESNELILK